MGMGIMDWTLGLGNAIDWFGKDAQATQQRNDALRMGWGHLHDLRNRTTDAVESAHSDINNMFGQYANSVRGDANTLSGQMAQAYSNLGATGNRLGNEMLSDMSTGHTNRINDFRSQYGNYESGVNQAHQGRMNMGTAGNSDLSNAYSGQYARNMARLDNAGQQEAQDIRRDFRNAGSSIDADMANRGLSGTTVGATMKQGLARRQSDALGALNERVNQQKLNADLTMSNNALASQERGIDRSLGTYGDAINSQQSMGNNRFAYDTGLTGSALSSRENILGANVGRNMGTSLAGIQNQESMGRMLGSLNQQLGQQQMGERRTQLTEDRSYDASTTDRLANLWSGVAGGIQNPSGSPLDMLGQLYMASQQPTTSGSDNSWLGSAIGGGATVAAETAPYWAPLLFASDRNIKESFETIDEAEVLAKVAELDVSRWKYKPEIGDDTPHIGPMAQDFHEAFEVGGDKAIHMADAVGVLMASVKALKAEVDALKGRMN